MRDLLKIEILLSFLLGSIPMILIRNQPDFSVQKALASLNPGDLVVNYFSCLLGIHFFVWFVNRLIFKNNNTLSNTFQRLHEFTHKLGFALHSIYRALAGAIPVAMILELEKHGITQGWKAITILSVFLSISFFFASLLLSKSYEYTTPRKSLFSK